MKATVRIKAHSRAKPQKKKPAAAKKLMAHGAMPVTPGRRVSLGTLGY
jgi:hypothetical protein